jgi:hypothetical protein
MKNHVWRPLLAAGAFLAFVLVFRIFYVPADFGVHERGYMYGWHREGNIQEWKDFKVKYQGSDYCNTCHPDKLETISMTPHAVIQCENCHGPAIDHPSDPPRLEIDRSREQCLRCHTSLIYPSSVRADIRGIDPGTHNPDIECVMCHNPHQPGLEGLQ